MQTPVWFDTDPGIDDAIALLWILNNLDKINLQSISTVVGNFPIEMVTNNALSICEYMDVNIPIHKGAEVRLSKTPFDRDEKLCIQAHGEDGLALINPTHSKKISSNEVSYNMAQSIRSSDQEWILLPVGPLTNIAQFIIDYPALTSKISRIYMMGGASTKIEFNILCDCEAANIVFNSGIPITMMPLDITTKIRVPQEKLNQFYESQQLLPWAKKLLEFGTLPDSDCMHDPCAVLAYIYPELFTGRVLYAQAITEGDKVGSLILSDTPINKNSSEILFLDSCDKEKVIQRILEGLITK